MSKEVLRTIAKQEKEELEATKLVKIVDESLKIKSTPYKGKFKNMASAGIGGSKTRAYEAEVRLGEHEESGIQRWEGVGRLSE
jgi:hypothetical protein